MTYFNHKTHLFEGPIPMGVSTPMGIIRSQATRHMGIASTLLLKNSDLSLVGGYFNFHRILTGASPAAVGMPHTSFPDGGMDEGLGAALAVNIGGSGSLDASFDVTLANDTATGLLYLVGDEIPPTARVHTSSEPTNRKVLRGRAEKTPSTGWVDLLELPLASGKAMAIRATIHTKEGGSIGAARWLVVAKNVAGTVTIVGDNRASGNAFYDYASNQHGLTTEPRATAGTNAVKLQCNGNSGAVIYSLFVDSAVTL